MEVDFCVSRETYQSFREITVNKKKLMKNVGKVFEVKLYL